MSYESAPATKLLATQCAICGRPLLDAVSVEVGIGPVCREKYGYDYIHQIPEELRAEANRLIYLVAAKQDGQEVFNACAQLYAMGFAGVVQAIMARIGQILISVTPDDHTHGAGRLAVRSPYNPKAVERFRDVPGRRWSKEEKLNTFPQASKVDVMTVLQDVYPGAIGFGPKGPFRL